jgi:transitional endoplasmic reticulum ATPase
MEKKKAPNKLIVEDATQDDNSVVMVTSAKLQELNIFRAEHVILKGKKRHNTCAIVLNTPAGDTLEDGYIRMNKVVRKNLRVRLGDVVTISAANDIPNGLRVHILPFEDTIEGVTGNLV